MLNIKSKKELLIVLEKIRQNRVCAYVNSVSFCDCKYGDLDKTVYHEIGTEQTGCYELRKCMAFILNHLEEQVIGACVICDCTVTQENIARTNRGIIGKDCHGNLWCQECTDRFDDLEPA